MGECSSQVSGDHGERKLLKRSIYMSQDTSQEDKQQIPDDDIIKWYADDVADIDTYINAAFRSSDDHQNEAYLFMKNEYVLLNYAPGTTDDKIVNGPLLICDGFPSLTDTAFGENGIDCAFACNGGAEAFIFLEISVLA
ncbi:hypothetical protein SLEP1_g17472 [Rubroshorea leprosula]|uniref:Uncharacterized protein n=1 Tax=Rubroshorea leprosula TaxID=152421 RepID=A0AAV5J1Z6_9ROSI|nr:hypothetical protein SLEP1_g17472 [Rubroshorea leprosula]